MSKLQSNGIIKLGLVKSLGLYCYLSPHKSQKSKLELVTDFQFNFLCINPDQVNHLKDFRGGIQKIWEFHLPYSLFGGRHDQEKGYFDEMRTWTEQYLDCDPVSGWAEDGDFKTPTYGHGGPLRTC